MGLMDELQNMGLGNVLGNSGAQGSNSLLPVVLQMIQNHPGGLSSLVQGFQNKGLGDIVNSWVSTGHNLPISPDQVTQALGHDQVNQMAANAGVSPAAASSSLAALLPVLIDKLTPNGQVPHQSSLLEQGMSMLNSLRTGTSG
ncbi:MAG TPA: YidB family protein [Terriglobales bacterium]|jgi:uncharacterized protein YidB (DUF937 family)|nr:YidB family protein [Terriglobales bacterium]